MQGKCRTTPLRATGGVLLKIPRRCGESASNIGIGPGPETQPRSIQVAFFKSLGSACCDARDGDSRADPQNSAKLAIVLASLGTTWPWRPTPGYNFPLVSKT